MVAFGSTTFEKRKAIKQSAKSVVLLSNALSYARRWEITLLTLYAFLDHITVTVTLNVMKLREFNH